MGSGTNDDAPQLSSESSSQVEIRILKLKNSRRDRHLYHSCATLSHLQMQSLTAQVTSPRLGLEFQTESGFPQLQAMQCLEVLHVSKDQTC
jgi:hypothetical protein